MSDFAIVSILYLCSMIVAGLFVARFVNKILSFNRDLKDTIDELMVENQKLIEEALESKDQYNEQKAINSIQKEINKDLEIKLSQVNDALRGKNG